MYAEDRKPLKQPRISAQSNVKKMPKKPKQSAAVEREEEKNMKEEFNSLANLINPQSKEDDEEIFRPTLFPETKALNGEISGANDIIINVTSDKEKMNKLVENFDDDKGEEDDEEDDDDLLAMMDSATGS